jgi:hypothetical protein
LAELELLTGSKGLFAQLGVILDTSGGDPDKTDKLDKLYSKVISLPGRVDAAKRLVETLEKVVRLEREVFGIGAEDGKESPIDAALKQIAQMKRDGIRPA